MHIQTVDTRFEQLPLRSPFGFKGGASSFLWNTAVCLQNGSGLHGVGHGTEGVLWSDAKVFFDAGNLSGSAMMYLLTDHAARQLRGSDLRDPSDALDALLPETMAYGRAVTGNPDLRMTFALDSLVPVDEALWQLWARENGVDGFDGVVPAYARGAMPCRHETLACIPLITYGVTADEIVSLAEEGAPLLKIKIGKEPDWDIRRALEVHDLVRDVETPYTDCGHVLYYLDANGRYDSAESLLPLLDALDKAGALDRVALLEEPFPEGSGIDVSRLPVVVAADESAHSDRDVEAMADLGYRAVALKPIAKTLTMTFRMLAAAEKRGMKTFCADLTVNPIMVDWSKNVAARLRPIGGMKIGAIESNGPQNYADWNGMVKRHPMPDAPWIAQKGGVFACGEEFYRTSGGIFEDSAYYDTMFGL